MLWDALTARLLGAVKPTYRTTALYGVVAVRTEVVAPKEIASGKTRLLDRVSFDGVVFPAESRATRMTQFRAQPGDVIVSKIRARQGSVGLVAPEHGPLGVSIHYRALTPDAGQIDTLFLWLALRSDYCRHQFLAATGGAMKGEISEQALLDMRVPLPPLATQRKIVAQWQKAQTEIAAARARADGIEAKARAAFLAGLGLREPAAISTRKAFALDFAHLDRWGVDFNTRQLGAMNLEAGKYPVCILGDCIEYLQYGSSEKASARPNGIPVLRMGNLKEGVIDFAGLKYLQPTERDLEWLRLNDGDILFNRTNSKELVGKCAVFTAQPSDYVFASYLIRVRTVARRLDPHFATFAINGPIGRQQVDAMSRQIIGQANINSQELRRIRLPLPPLPVQEKLVATIATARAEAARERAAAAKLTAAAALSLEADLLGPVRT